MACVITRYDCENEEESREISDLIDKAVDQQRKNNDFSEIWPWLGGCSLADRHYIAQRKDGTICGWMSVKEKEHDGIEYLYLSEISVIRTQHPDFKGVGKGLHDKLVQDGLSEGKAFIYLVPLNDTVVNTYKKWGYYLPNEEDKSRRMFFDLKEHPSDEFMEAIKPEEPEPDEYINHLLERVDPENTDLLDRISKVEDKIKSKGELVEKLIKTVSTIFSAEGVDDSELDDEGIQSLIEEFVKEVEQAGGRRKKTRRHKRGKRTRRSHRR